MIKNVVILNMLYMENEIRIEIRTNTTSKYMYSHKKERELQG